MNDNLRPSESTSLLSRSVLAVLCLAAGFTYRASVSLIPLGIFEEGFLLGLAALFLAVALLLRSEPNLKKYWEIPFAFFVFTIAGLIGDAMVSPLQSGFVQGVLHQTPSAQNPLASTVLGTVLAQLVGTLCLVIPIIILTRASGSDVSSIFIDQTRKRWPLVVGVIGFLVFYLLIGLGLGKGFIPNNGVTLSRYLALTPALLVLVLLNGLREELWFRGLFLKKYGKVLGPFSSNLVAAIIFTSFHVQIQYAASLLPFLGITLILGLFLGFLMQRSGSVLAPAIFHAGTDIPIFLAYLSYAST